MAPTDLSGGGAELLRKEHVLKHPCKVVLALHTQKEFDEQDCQGDIGVLIGASDDRYILFFSHNQ